MWVGAYGGSELTVMTVAAVALTLLGIAAGKWLGR